MTLRRPFEPQEARAMVEPLRGLDGALLPMLHRLQDAYGWIDPQAVPVLADLLNLSRAEVHGVVSFYSDFRSSPPGRHVIAVCRAEACQAAGGTALLERACGRFGIGPGATTADGRWTLDQVFCLGLCACGPAVMLDGEPHGRLTVEAFDQLVDAVEEGR